LSEEPQKTEVEWLEYIARLLEASNANMVKFNDNILKALNSLAEYSGAVKEYPATLFSEEDLSKIEIVEKEDCWIVKPRKFLGRNTFGRISGAVREAGGEYVSQGKDSHFRIPKE